MTSDIKFQAADVVVVEGRSLNVKAPDFLLDYAPRRKGKAPYRRALVHDQNDGLTLNFNQDYPAGVTMFGQARVRKGGFICDESIVTGGDLILKRPGGDVWVNRVVDDLVERVVQLEARLA